MIFYIRSVLLVDDTVKQRATTSAAPHGHRDIADSGEKSPLGSPGVSGHCQRMPRKSKVKLRQLQSGAAEVMTIDSVFLMASTTKAITGTALMQCVEEGKLDLDDPAKAYVPDIGKLQVLDRFDDAGKPKLRPPRRDVTTRMLMLHTAGLGYDIFNAHYSRLAQEHGQPSVFTCSKRR
jgi:hypothetical protein